MKGDVFGLISWVKHTQARLNSFKITKKPKDYWIELAALKIAYDKRLKHFIAGRVF